MDATALVDPSMLAVLALLPRDLVTFFYAIAALLLFFSMDPLNLPTRPKRPLPCWVGASPPLSWRQRLSWLISTLSGTVEIVEETARLREENARYDAWIATLDSAERSRNCSSSLPTPAEPNSGS